MQTDFGFAEVRPVVGGLKTERGGHREQEQLLLTQYTSQLTQVAYGSAEVMHLVPLKLACGGLKMERVGRKGQEYPTGPSSW